MSPIDELTSTRFEPTQWNVVRQVKSQDEHQARAALEKLCSIYWPALYGYIRRRGNSPEDAKDLTQEFLSRLIEKNWLSRLQDRRAKFRSFLLTFLEHFLSDERDRANALKRGGGCTIIPLDAFDAEERAAFESSDHLTPDQVYSRRWAHSVLLEAARRLEAEYVSRGKAALYAVLKDLEPGRHGPHGYAEVGTHLGMTEQAIKNAAFAFRRRFGDLLREVIAQTVSDPAQCEEEIRELIALAG